MKVFPVFPEIVICLSGMLAWLKAEITKLTSPLFLHVSEFKTFVYSLRDGVGFACNHFVVSV